MSVYLSAKACLLMGSCGCWQATYRVHFQYGSYCAAMYVCVYMVFPHFGFISVLSIFIWRQQFCNEKRSPMPQVVLSILKWLCNSTFQHFNMEFLIKNRYATTFFNSLKFNAENVVEECGRWSIWGTNVLNQFGQLFLLLVTNLFNQSIHSINLTND